MATVQPVAAGARFSPGEARTAPKESAVAEPLSPGAATAETGRALVPAPRSPADEESAPEFGLLVARLPVEMDVAVPVREFRVRNLLALEPGSVIESQWNHGTDLPLAAGDVDVAWTEFEVVESRMAVRVTRLA